MAGKNVVIEGVEYDKDALAIFSTREQNMILKASLDDAGDMWVVKFLPKRFDKKYMERRPFNHSTRSLSFKQKVMKAYFMNGPQNRYDFKRLRPNVMSGKLMDTALAGARTVTKAPKGNVRALIKIPLGHAVKEKTTELIATIPKMERNEIMKVFKSNIIKWSKAGSVKRTKRGRVAKKSGIPRRTLEGVTSSLQGRRLNGGN